LNHLNIWVPVFQFVRHISAVVLSIARR
jgi:hypothetical protein